MVARVVNSSNKHWWIYHENSYSGANKEAKIAKDVRLKDDSDVEDDLIKEEDLFRNPERMLWKVVKYSYEAKEEIKGHKLMKGDIVKIGRVRFKIREINSPGYEKMERKNK